MREPHSLSMPRYFFDIHHDKFVFDREGEELSDDHAAWKEATVVAGRILQAWTAIWTLAGKEIEVRTRRPRSVNLDGEIRIRTPVRFAIRAGAIAVYAPARDTGTMAAG